MVKLVIFDLDGTLLDTLTDIGESVNETLRTYGYPEHPIDSYRNMVGNGAETLLRRAVRVHMGTREFSEMYLAFRKVYQRRSCENTRPYDGVAELLYELRKREIASAVLSNKPHDAALEVVPHYFPEHEFVAVIGLRGGGRPKPDPEGAIEILTKLRVPSSECVYVGDSGVDMLTAKNAGLIAVGALWGFRTEEELTENGAKYLIKTPGELLSVIDEN